MLRLAWAEEDTLQKESELKVTNTNWKASTLDACYSEVSGEGG